MLDGKEYKGELLGGTMVVVEEPNAEVKPEYCVQWANSEFTIHIHFQIPSRHTIPDVLATAAAQVIKQYDAYSLQIFSEEGHREHAIQ